MSKALEAAAVAMCLEWGYSPDHDPEDEQTVAPDGEEITYCPRPSMRQFRAASRATITAYLRAIAEEARDELAEIVSRVADEGLPGPRDLDVALDAIIAIMGPGE